MLKISAPQIYYTFNWIQILLFKGDLEEFKANQDIAKKAQMVHRFAL